MTRSTAFIPVSSPPASGLCYTEEARAGRGLFVVLQDVAPGAGQVRESFIRAVYREIVTRFQSAVHPETSEALLRGVVRSLDGVARQVETRVADFRGLGIHILVFEGRRASLLCGRDVPARVRVGGLVIPVAAGVAGARELPIETVRAQQDLFAQSLTDSLTLYRFELKEPGGVEFFLGGLQEDVAAALDALEVSRPGGRVVLERASHVVLHVPWAVTERRESAADRNAARAVRPPGRRLPLTRVALAVAGVLIAAAGYAAIRDLVGRGGGEEAQSVRATQERARPQEVREEPTPSVSTADEVAAVTDPAPAGDAARGFAETWQRTYRDAVTSSPAEAGAVVVFGARDGNVYALDPKTGGAVWTHRAGGGVGASPVVAGDAVFVCDYAGNVFRLGRSDGSVAWKRGLKEKIVSTPAVTGERVFVGTMRGNVYALSRDTGRVLWKFRTRGQIRGSLAAAKESVFVPSHDGKLYALSPETGKTRWSANLGGPVTSSPALGGGRVFVGTAKGSVLALDAASGRKVWSFSTGGAVNAWLRAEDGRIYAGSSDRALYCIDAARGELLWKYATAGVILSRPGVAGSRVIVTSYDGAVYCLDAASGELMGRYETSDAIFSSPLVMGDRVYFGNNGGRFFGLELPN